MTQRSKRRAGILAIGVLRALVLVPKARLQELAWQARFLGGLLFGALGGPVAGARARVAGRAARGAERPG